MERLGREMLDDVLFYGVLGVIGGGRLGYVLFYKPLEYLDHPLDILKVWEGGMSFHGGFLGVILAMALFARRHKLRWLAVTDFIAPLVPLGWPPGGSAISSTANCGGAPPILPWGNGVFRRRPTASRAILRSCINSR